MADTVSVAQRSRIMAKIKSRDTQPELTLRRALWKRGLRYRVHVSGLPGRPDIVFPSARVAVFVDGSFWHGRKLSEERLSRMSTYWQEKIKKTVSRDEKLTKVLQDMGWRVLRYDDREIARASEEIATVIESFVRLGSQSADRLKHSGKLVPKSGRQ